MALAVPRLSLLQLSGGTRDLQSWTKALEHLCIRWAFFQFHIPNPFSRPSNTVERVYAEIFLCFNFVQGGWKKDGKKISKISKHFHYLCGQAESTENYEYCITVPMNFVQDCSSQKTIDLTPAGELGIFFRVSCVTGPINIILIKLIVLRARVAQWWEHSSLTNVARLQILASTLYVGWVYCWFSPLFREVFLRILRFSPLLKNQHLGIQIRSGTHRHDQTRFNEFIWTPKCSAGTNYNFSFKAIIPSSHRSFCFSGLFRRVFLSSVLNKTRGREKGIISLYIFYNYSLKSRWIEALVTAKQQGKHF